jgi:hypothetical protein
MKRSLAAAALFLFALVGCGPDGPQMVEVSGTVKYDGKDVPDGDIMFVPENKAIGPDAGKIKDGKYAFKVKSGRHRVEITALRKIPGKKDAMGEDATEHAIPEKYNVKSELTVEVAPGKANHPFDLKK